MRHSDDLLARANRALRDATLLLADVAATVYLTEPIRRRIHVQVGVLDDVLDELDRILDDARDELP